MLDVLTLLQYACIVAAIFLAYVVRGMSGFGAGLIAAPVNALGLPQFRCSRRWAIPLGFTGAFSDTLFGGGGGTLVVIYMHGREIERMAFRATLATLWFMEMATRISGYALAGYYTPEWCSCSWACFTSPGSASGSASGSETV
jgi:uncharacterized membrane protein YfcA